MFIKINNNPDGETRNKKSGFRIERSRVGRAGGRKRVATLQKISMAETQKQNDYWLRSSSSVIFGGSIQMRCVHATFLFLWLFVGRIFECMRAIISGAKNITQEMCTDNWIKRRIDANFLWAEWKKGNPPKWPSHRWAHTERFRSTQIQLQAKQLIHSKSSRSSWIAVWMQWSNSPVETGKNTIMLNWPWNRMSAIRSTRNSAVLQQRRKKTEQPKNTSKN